LKSKNSIEDGIYFDYEDRYKLKDRDI